MIYFDNAATTPLHPEVKEAMIMAMEMFGNPTSIHAAGRSSRVFVEEHRSNIAQHLQCAPAEIIFTSGGTEALQTAITGAIRQHAARPIITTPLEHHAVLHNLEAKSTEWPITIHHVRFDELGRINTAHLETLLSKRPGSLVVLMHANNETGMLLPLKEVASLCKKFNALLLTDTVQTIGKYKMAFPEGLTFAAASAHKFHGPKGVGFLYNHHDNVIEPLILGGGQERNMRSGTENIIGIAGMSKALEVAMRDLDATKPLVEELRNRMILGIKQLLPEANILTHPDHSLYTILNVGFPVPQTGEMLIYRFDMADIAVSGGSACASGVNHPSHVLDALNTGEGMEHVRFSFSRFNTIAEVDQCLEVLKSFLK